MAKYCVSCGAQIPDEAEFCSECGARQPKFRRNSQSGQTASANTPPSGQTEPFQQFNQQQQATANNANGYIPEKTIQEKFLSQEGRLDKSRFFKRTILLNVIEFGLIFLYGALFADDFGDLSKGMEILFHILQAVFLYPEYCLAVRRMKDFSTGKSGDIEFLWAKVLVVLDAIYIFSESNLVLAAYLACYFYLVSKKGITGPNPYGPDPLG